MKIKQKPEDFVVEEIPDFEVEESGDYTFFLLEKRNWNTKEAIAKVAKQLKIKENRFNVAGIKDKKAVTKQYVSVFKVKREALEKLRIKDIDINFVGYGKERLSLGQLKGNKFRIVVRDVDKELNKIEFVANFFDDQRFGGKNHLLGKALLKKEFSKFCAMLRLKVENNDCIGAMKKHGFWFLRFYLSSYQSFLFNEVLANYIKNNYSKYSEVDYKAGNFVFLKEDYKKNIKIPILNFDTEFEEEEIENIYRDILEKEGVMLDDFIFKQIPELISETVYRGAFVEVKDFDLEKKDQDVILYFTLPPGSYATLVVKKIFSISFSL